MTLENKYAQIEELRNDILNLVAAKRELIREGQLFNIRVEKINERRQKNVNLILEQIEVLNEEYHKLNDEYHLLEKNQWL
jgi:predicted  nucleic acid-binding Zn-ribbon protein